MSDIKKCIIVVPVYRDVPNELEQLSLTRLDEMNNGEYSIRMVGPSWTNLNEYLKLFKLSEVAITYFDDSYFASNKSYSQLCLNYDFYKVFDEYEYMMIYQTDCWLFTNKITVYCDMGYDYIGAPIYSPGSKWPGFKTIGRPIVGNGGLSIRRIKKMLELTDPNGYLYNKHKDEWNSVEYEDMFICDVLAHDVYINIPNYTIAEKFAIDTIPPYIKSLKLPMGVHRVFALYKIWEPHVPELSGDHIIELCENEYEKFKKAYS